MSDETAQDPQLPPHTGSQEPAEGGEVPDAGPGAEHGDDEGSIGAGGPPA